MKKLSVPPGFQDMLEFGLVEALFGRRSRRFFMGAEIPDGVFTYKSRHSPFPLFELEKLLVASACGMRKEESKMTQGKKVNGLDVDQLMGTIETVKKNPEIVRFVPSNGGSGNSRGSVSRASISIRKYRHQ